MKVDAQTLLEALEGRLAAQRIASLTADLRQLPPAEIFSLTRQANLSISGDGNIVGDNNVSIVVKGEGAAELATVLRKALYRGRALFQLRQPVGDFVGRETEIKELMVALRSNQAAAISGISGMGGIGKTELALYVADKLRAEYPDAQLFVSLRGTDPEPRSAADALQSCLRALVGLEAKLPEEVEALTQLYRSQLTGKRALILLDNAADSAQVKPLIPPIGCALLVTSRTKLALSGGKRIMLDQLQPLEARVLLLSIAPQLTEDMANQIASLCGYLPLALRAAGSLLAVTEDLEPADYIEELRNERTRLEKIGTEEIDRGVEATFNLSYARLPDETARVFRALSVMRSSFDAKAAEVIAEDERHAQLSELVKRSLVSYDITTKRYRLHDLTRLFADSMLSGAEREACGKRHAEHYREVLSSADEYYLQGNEMILVGLALYDQDRVNIEAGQGWATTRINTDRQAARLAGYYFDAGAYVLDLRLHPLEKIKWLEAAVAGAREIGDRHSEGNALGNLGIAYKNLGKVRKAIQYYKQRIKIAREIGDRQGEGKALGNLGNAYYSLGEERKAIKYYEQRLQIALEIGVAREVMAVIGNLGSAYYSLAEERKAIEHYELALKIAEKIGDVRIASGMIVNLGNAYYSLGEVQRAIGYFEQHVPIARAIGDRRGEGNALGNLGTAYANLGEVRRAIGYYEQHVQIAREIGDRRGEGNACWNLALAWEQLGDRAQAIAGAEAALLLYEQIEDPDAAKVRQQLAEWKTSQPNEGETP